MGSTSIAIGDRQAKAIKGGVAMAITEGGRHVLLLLLVRSFGQAVVGSAAVKCTS